MDEKKVVKKGLELISSDNIVEDLDLINMHTISKLNADDVYMFKIVLCDNDVDRSFDKMSDEFLNEFAERCKGLTGLKDHDWESDNQLARLYDAEVVLDENTITALGEARKYVLGKAYTLSKYQDYIDKINAGLLKESSISFNSKGDTCSICGKVTEKGYNGIAVCPDGHIMGKEYDGKLCYNQINELDDVFEWSLVAVPCQRGSGIKNKSTVKEVKGTMKKSMFLFEKLSNSKAFKGLDDEIKNDIKNVIETEDETELSEEDIKKLINENAELTEKVAVLETKLAEAENARTIDRIESIVEKEVDNLNPITPVVKENIMRDIDMTTLVLGEDDKIEGLDDAMESIKERYEGLIKVDAEGEDETVKETVEEETKKVCKSVIKFSVGANEKGATKQIKSGLTFK